MIEVWKDIPGYEGSYQASSLGRIKSLPRVLHRKNGTRYTVNERILKTRLTKTGYELVTLCLNSVFTHFSVHRIVAMTFLGARPDGYDIAHFDGNKTNNCLKNLRYATRYENCADKLRHGVSKRGDKSHFAKLAIETVLKIRKETGSQQAIAKKYGISQSNVSMIKRLATWSDI